jgi:hypothetical protein
VEMFLTCCGWGRVFSSCRHGGSHLSKVCSKRTKRHQPNRCRYFACSDSVQGKDYNGLRASKIANLLQTIDLDELRKELRMNLENALRKAKNKGELKLTEDELRILDKLEKQGEEELKNIFEKMKEEMSTVPTNEEQQLIMNETALKQEKMLQDYDQQVDKLLQVMQTERKNLDDEKRLLEQLRKQYDEYLRRKEAMRPNTLPKVLLMASAITFGLSSLYYVGIAFGTDQNSNLQNAVWNALATVAVIFVYERQMMKK